MTITDRRPLITPGEEAPGFTLPVVNQDGIMSLDDYRGRTAVLLALFRWLH